MARIIIFIGICAALGYGVYAFKDTAIHTIQQGSVRVANSIEYSTQKKTVGITMFRGNGTRTFYGTGPVPLDPTVLWHYPKETPLCAFSIVARVSRQWCGSGWTGQPVVWERPDGSTEIIVGTYDKQIHFIDAVTGLPTRTPFPTGDIIKGSVTLDPDGFPLLYSGSRDNFYRIIALDRAVPTELWKKEARVSDGYWNNDWDSNGLVEDDILYQGSENGLFHIIKLNRSFNAEGFVQVAPEILMTIPTFSDDFIATLGDTEVSIESSPMKYGDTVYISNSGGRIMGFDVSRILEKEAPVVFDFWTGDDTDATLIADEKGFLYVASEDERKNARSKEVGQLMKLNPYTADNPLVWSIHIPGTSYVDGGVWATPALASDYLYVPTNPGELLTVDTKTGTITSTIPIGTHAWSSPAVVDETLIVGTCEGTLRAFSLNTPATPTPLWTLPIKNKGCIESTPAIWKGSIYVGSREGYIFKIGQ